MFFLGFDSLLSFSRVMHYRLVHIAIYMVINLSTLIPLDVRTQLLVVTGNPLLWVQRRARSPVALLIPGLNHSV